MKVQHAGNMQQYNPISIHLFLHAISPSFAQMLHIVSMLFGTSIQHLYTEHVLLMLIYGTFMTKVRVEPPIGLYNSGSCKQTRYLMSQIAMTVIQTITTTYIHDMVAFKIINLSISLKGIYVYTHY